MGFGISTAFLPLVPLKPKRIGIFPRRLSRNTVPCAHLRRRAPPLPPKNTGFGSKENYVDSVRYPHLKLFTRVWEPMRLATAGLIIIPGLQWHTGWFSTIALPLRDHGIRVLAVDPLSTGRSDDLAGLRGYITNLDDHVDDIEAALNTLSDGLPKGSPVFVLSESSGGVIACMLAKRQEVTKRVRGWIFCSPAVTIAPQLLPPPFVTSLLRIIGKRFPRLPMPGEQLSGSTYDEAFGDGISHELSKRDPFVLYQVPVRLGTAVAMLNAMDEIETMLVEKALRMSEVLILHNRLDKRTLYSGSEGLANRILTDHGAKLVDPGGKAHQLFQERTAVVQETVGTILEFIEGLRDLRG